MLPWKTILTVVTFVGAMFALRQLDKQIFDPLSAQLVWQLPVPKPAPIQIEQVKTLKIVVAPSAGGTSNAAGGTSIDGTPQSQAYSYLSDPNHELDPFYQALDH